MRNLGSVVHTATEEIGFTFVMFVATRDTFSVLRHFGLVMIYIRGMRRQDGTQDKAKTGRAERQNDM